MACTHVIKGKYNVLCIAISPDGQLLAAGGDGVQLLDARSGERRAGLGAALCVAFSPAGASRLLLAAGYLDNTVRVWECSGSSSSSSSSSSNDAGVPVPVAVQQGHSDSVHCVAFSPDGRLLASASLDRTVRLWRTDDWSTPPAVRRDHTHYVYGVSFSCDGRLLASCSLDFTVRLWHIHDSGAAAAAAAPAAGPVLEVGKHFYCVAFSPVDSRLLAFGGAGDFLVLARVGADDGAIAVERELYGHTELVRSLAFSNCGRKLASASWDKTVRLWSVASGACLRVLQGHTSALNALAFYPSGKQLASCSSDGTVRIWTLCAWTDKSHHLFGAPLKAAIFTLMCVRARLEQEQEQGQGQVRLLPRLPMEVWLLVFGQLQLVMDAEEVFV